MKHNNFMIKKLFSFVLIFMLALSMAVPVMAVEGDTSYSITITNNSKLSNMVDDQFTAYQIFKGTLNADTPNNRQLADISWGNGINAAAFVEALKADETLGADFAYVISVVNNVQAAEVTDVLVKKKDDSSFLQAFAKIASANLNKTAGVNSKLDTNNNSVISVTDPGYYLIVENKEKIPGTDGENNNKVVSSFILDVLGNQTVEIKTDIPDVNKAIVVGSENVKGDTANIGDTVEFKLTGTLPKNYDDFTSYTYKFVDTLSAGLTFITDEATPLTVTVKNGENTTEIPKNQYVVSVDDKLEDGSTKVNIEFKDLKSVVDAEENSVTITADSEVIVTYYAKLNSNAVAGSTGNPNKVYLEYSSDPNNSGAGSTTPPSTTTTTEKIVYVYDLGLEITKLASDKLTSETGAALEGAEFILSKTEGETIYYAQFAEPAVGETNRKLSGWTEKAEEATALATDSNGKFYVEGLDVGTYTLTESKTPTGYNTMDSITFTISAEIDENGVLTAFKAAVNGERTDVSVLDGILSTGLIPMQLTNQAAPFLPFTGGAGLVVVYVLGGALLAGAAAYLIISGSKKKSK